ncbi:MAG: CarD family transcriptional regulator [Lachnospiraceae bacterium]|nr:CarD family transcriptional regulator [Lachnospiraceae bacterium]
MFNKNDYVIYGQNGVCIVEDITENPFEGAPKGKVYYVLFAVGSENKIYVPCDIGNSKMRKVLNKKEAMDLISCITSIEPLEAENEKQLEELYKNAVQSNDCIQLIRLIKCIHYRKKQRLSEGKQMTSTDRKYMDMAENSLYLEMGTALGVKKSEVLPLILEEVSPQRISKQER